MVNFKALHFKDFASVATWGDVGSTCSPLITVHCLLCVSNGANDASQTPALNLLSPHDALKHHFTSLKTDLIFLQPWVLERK